VIVRFPTVIIAAVESAKIAEDAKIDKCNAARKKVFLGEIYRIANDIHPVAGSRKFQKKLEDGYFGLRDAYVTFVRTGGEVCRLVLRQGFSAHDDDVLIHGVLACPQAGSSRILEFGANPKICN